MIDFAFMFTIFMVVLGPIKTVPGFFMLTHGRDPGDARRLALRGALIATAISLLVALAMRGTMKSWHVTPDDLRIAGGLLLFASAWKSLSPSPSDKPKAKPEGNIALSPLAIPVIVTPWGVAAILVFVGIASDDQAQLMRVITAIVAIMALNLVGMLFARQIIRLVTITGFKLLGWIFSVLQAGLAVHAIIFGIRSAFGMNDNPGSVTML